MNRLRGETYLWCQVESQITATGKTVLNKKRNLVGQAKLDSAGKTTGLAEVDEVFEGKGKRDWFTELNLNIVLWLIDVCVASESDSTVTDISVALELDTILGGLN